MSFLLVISGFAVVIYLPVAALATLGMLALWNKLHSPGLWQVLAATACIVILPWLINGLSMGKGFWLTLSTGFLAYVPVLIPAVLWALQRRGSDGGVHL